MDRLGVQIDQVGDCPFFSLEKMEPRDTAVPGDHSKTPEVWQKDIRACCMLRVVVALTKQQTLCSRSRSRACFPVSLLLFSYIGSDSTFALLLLCLLLFVILTKLSKEPSVDMTERHLTEAVKPVTLISRAANLLCVSLSHGSLLTVFVQTQSTLYYSVFSLCL